MVGSSLLVSCRTCVVLALLARLELGIMGQQAVGLYNKARKGMGLGKHGRIT